MKKSKVFLIMAGLFVVVLAYISYDISSRTTFPGSKSQLKGKDKKAVSSPRFNPIRLHQSHLSVKNATHQRLNQVIGLVFWFITAALTLVSD
ncbi:MAG: hypothetical protein KDC99_15165 [Cyclobacteriaceae bacterium]|nr:hypothetical protein [Cyclobacteriaceae bacterium]